MLHLYFQHLLVFVIAALWVGNGISKSIGGKKIINHTTLNIDDIPDFIFDTIDWNQVAQQAQSHRDRQKSNKEGHQDSIPSYRIPYNDFDIGFR